MMTDKYESSIRKMAWLVIFTGVVAFIILFKLYFISFSLGPDLIVTAREKVIQERQVPASRGNIYSSDGQLLATSMPVYELRWDAAVMDPLRFKSEVKKTSKALSDLFGIQAKTQKYWEDYLRKTFRSKKRYAFLIKDISYTEYQKVKKMSLFRGNKYETGLIAHEKHTRLMPLGVLAKRTIGYVRGNSEVGLESSFNHVLKGNYGKRWMQNFGGNQWKPIDSDFSTPPVNGKDIVTTINSRIQDIAHKSLIEQLKKFNADHGCVIVMEASSGKIRAMVNLGKTDKDEIYRELRNYAVWEKSEPGSTFKVAALLVALEDGKVDTAQKVDTKGGTYTIYGRKVKDSKKDGYGLISLGRALELSSNTGIVKALYPEYKNNPKEFIDRMYQIGLADKSKIQIPGESIPFIPEPGTSKWNGLSLPWMLFGYGVENTPLQTLMFYNAIANNGTMVNPTIWEATRDHGLIIKNHETMIAHPSIASRDNINQIKDLLEKAVRRGTAKNIYSDSLEIAGKTGTSQLNYWDPEKKGYQASFAGYFPAKNPEYSCIVVINRPEISTGFYGNIVAAPVFKDIAMSIHKMTPQINTPMQGYWDDAIQLVTQQNESEASSKFIRAAEKLEEGKIPNIIGWKSIDAIELFENKKWEIKLQGNGAVIDYKVEKPQKKILIRLG